jgi:hypothetical protein
VQPHVSNETVGSGIELVQPEEAIAVRIVFVALWVNAFTSYPDGIVRFSNFLRMRGWDAETFGQAQRLTLAAAINDEELVSDKRIDWSCSVTCQQDCFFRAQPLHARCDGDHKESLFAD